MTEIFGKPSQVDRRTLLRRAAAARPERAAVAAPQAAGPAASAKSIRDGGNTPMATTPEEFSEMLARDLVKWRQLIQRADIKPPA